MKTLIKLLPALCAALAMAMPAQADNGATAHPIPAVQTPALVQACPAPSQGPNLAQVSQADCCKGHKGVCGCRAGKIMCCDNTTSPTCTCHTDSGIEN